MNPYEPPENSEELLKPSNDKKAQVLQGMRLIVKFSVAVMLLVLVALCLLLFLVFFVFSR